MAPLVKFGLLFLVVLGLFLPEALPRLQQSGAIQRVVCLSPAETQNLAYLGQIAKVVAVSPYDQHPAAQNLPKVAGINASDEEILRHRPDMVLVSETREFDRLSSKGILVHVSQTGGLEAVYSNLLALEKIFSTPLPSKAEEFHKGALLPNASLRGSFVLAVGISPLYSVSTNTFLSQILEKAGWQNAVQTLPAYPVLGDEALSRIRGDVLLAPIELTQEIAALEKIRKKIGAGRLVILSNQNLFLPSPYLLDEIENLKNL